MPRDFQRHHRRKGRNPNWDEAVLAKGQPEPRMRDDVEREIPDAPGVGNLVCGRSPQRNATKDERASVVGEFLFAVSAFLAHEADGIELFDSLLRQTERWKYGLKRVERQGLRGGRWSGPPLGVRAGVKEQQCCRFDEQQAA